MRIDKQCKRTDNKCREGKERKTCQRMLRVRVIEMRAEALIRGEGEIKEVLAAHFCLRHSLKDGLHANLLPRSHFHLITATVIFSNLLKLASSHG